MEPEPKKNLGRSGRRRCCAWKGNISEKRRGAHGAICACTALAYIPAKQGNESFPFSNQRAVYFSMFSWVCK